MALNDLNENTTQDLSASLLVLATYSNFYSIVTVLVCFIITVVFILRLNGDHLAFSSSVVVKHVISEQRMIGIQNPFSVQMDPSCTSSLLSGLHCLVSSLASSSLCCYWGVDIDALYKEFQLPWKYLQYYINSEEFLVGSYIHKEQPLQLNSCNEKKLFLPTPQVMKDVVMASSSRTRYPVVLLNLSLNKTYSSEGCVEVVALMSVIHLKDTTCSMNSCIINQHLKTCNNQILNLQPLFVASTPAAEDIDASVTSLTLNTTESSNDPTHEFSTNQKHLEKQSTKITSQNARDSECLSRTERNECIVCQCEQITTVLLPCRHACVCSICFAKLERCPMCREFIYSYFWLEGNCCKITSPSASVPPLSNIPGQSTFVTSSGTQERRSFKQWMVQLNDTINNYLGFR